MCSTGQLSNLKAQGILLLSLVVTIVNLVNLVILEVGEWRGFLSQTDKDFAADLMSAVGKVCWVKTENQINIYLM